jgi:hypothetical protein
MNITVYLEWTIYLLYQKYYNIIYWKSTTIYYFSYLSFRKKKLLQGRKGRGYIRKKKYMTTIHVYNDPWIILYALTVVDNFAVNVYLLWQHCSSGYFIRNNSIIFISDEVIFYIMYSVRSKHCNIFHIL